MPVSSQNRNANYYPVLFSSGFRPFFFGAGLFAGIAMPLWVLIFVWGLDIPSVYKARDWHFHEMVFGYVPAVIAGFLLTAVPNWTGRPAIVGKPLMLLWVTWASGRVVMAYGENYPIYSALVDSVFLVSFSVIIWRELIGGRNIRNAPIGVIISLIAIANLVFHYLSLKDGQFINIEIRELFERLALGAIAMLLSVVGGRITPVFTTNWLRMKGVGCLPPATSRFDNFTLVVSAFAIVLWVLQPDNEASGLGFVVVAPLSFVRVIRWRGWVTWREPLLLILHIGHLWLTIWFTLMAIAILYPDMISQNIALHALTAGGVGTMTLAVMTRVSLGHSGRPLKAGAGAVLIYTLVFIGAIMRVFIDWIPIEYSVILTVSGAMWSLAFLLFSLLWGPLFFQKIRV